MVDGDPDPGVEFLGLEGEPRVVEAVEAVRQEPFGTLLQQLDPARGTTDSACLDDGFDLFFLAWLRAAGRIELGGGGGRVLMVIQE